MRVRWLLGIAGLVGVAAGAACSATEDDLSAEEAAVAAGFDKNDLMSDAALRDKNALNAEQIQLFLEKNPWGNQSVLASYKEGGKRASDSIYESAQENGINPIALLVRLQMEQSLINRESAPRHAIEIAFGCGCPHSPVCGPSYMGFGN
jgi:hypothetical protein